MFHYTTKVTTYTFARYESVADVSGGAGADGTLGTGAVVSGSALGVGTTWVGLAKVT